MMHLWVLVNRLRWTYLGVDQTLSGHGALIGGER
jgi:hypothetical protein